MYREEKACDKRNPYCIIIIIIIIICKEAKKGKVLPVHAMKVYRGRKGTASLIPKPCADVNFTSQSLSH